ncbi:DUF5794 domain-containing protein [Halobacteria archaeon AArc-m2/3/4]|uniref:DUF5794 domain-containing protein n=1 Tax=Natronoglomus mannanivorans TaxID=2979990 RepID=A0AAP2YWY8_9EURY|nr:DUF5794 domain-containing protein [Halobacteria archaeon AArc-xg1-1]MCU4971342.1 DUF5794 domain-containing protein [Halobacteria archaeon AArc-m2/3/4]
MSTSQHPVALRLESLVGGDARLLAMVMGLPLIDGVFAALVLSGALDDPIGAIQVGLLIFGGSATVAVILADMDGAPLEQAKIVLLVGIPLILLAAVQAALAPALDSVLDIVIFERFAALVIMAIAAKTASATIGEYLPSPGIIIALGLVASIDPAGAELAVLHDPGLVVNATGAAVVGVAFALSIALLGPYLREYMDIDRFRFGSAVALGLLPLAILGMPFGNAPLAVLAVAALFAFDPDRDELADTITGVLGDDRGTRADGGPHPSGEPSAGEDSTETGTGTESNTDTDNDPLDEPYPGPGMDDSDDDSSRAPWL